MKALVSGAYDKGTGKEARTEETSGEMRGSWYYTCCVGVGLTATTQERARETGSLTASRHLLPTEASTAMPSPSPSPSSLQLPTDQTSKHLLKPDRNLARALSTGQCDLSSSTGFQIQIGCGWRVNVRWRFSKGTGMSAGCVAPNSYAAVSWR